MKKIPVLLNEVAEILTTDMGVDREIGCQSAEDMILMIDGHHQWTTIETEVMVAMEVMMLAVVSMTGMTDPLQEIHTTVTVVPLPVPHLSTTTEGKPPPGPEDDRLTGYSNGHDADNYYDRFYKKPAPPPQTQKSVSQGFLQSEPYYF